MYCKQWPLITVLVLSSCIVVVAQGQGSASQPSQRSPLRTLRNSDVVGMVQRGEKAGDILAEILTSRCNFDVFPPVLRDLKRRGVPDTVIVAMKAAPNGPPALGTVDAKIAALTAKAQIPAGTVIELESARAYSSANMPVGSLMTFLVTRRVFVNNVLVIERGAVAKAQVVQRKRAATWGRPGMLAWEMQYVTAVDGTQVPIQLTGKQIGAGRRAVIAGSAVATGALVFPYSSPVALIWGLKKGEEAVLRGSSVFNAQLGKEKEVTGLQPRPEGVVYHDRDTVKASTAPPTNTAFDRSGFRPKASFKP